MFEFQTQSALYSLLTNNAELMDEITNVYDYIPQDSSYPFVVLGDANHELIGHSTGQNSSGIFSVHTFVQGTSNKKLTQIQALIYEALHDKKQEENNLSWVLWRNTQPVIIESDQVTRHGVQDFTFWVHDRI